MLTLVDSLQETLQHQWLIVHATVASTPTTSLASVANGGRFGLGEQIERTRFEVRVQRSSDSIHSPAGSHLWVTHQTAVYSRTERGTFERDRLDALNGRARRAPVAPDRDVLLVLSHDVLDPRGKLLIASIALENNQLAEPALSQSRAASIDTVFAATDEMRLLVAREELRWNSR